MVFSQSSFVLLHWQSFKQVSMPKGGEGVGEGERLRTALLGVYEFVLHQESRYEFNFAIFYNKHQGLKMRYA
jgi:hypothetical protein